MKNKIHLVVVVVFTFVMIAAIACKKDHSSKNTTQAQDTTHKTPAVVLEDTIA